MGGPSTKSGRTGPKAPGVCSYCGKIHKKGKKRGDSCRGHGKMEKGS